MDLHETPLAWQASVSYLEVEHVCQSDRAERQVLFLCNNFSHWCENCSNSSCMGPVHGSDFLLPKPLIYTEKCRLIHEPTACYRSITLQAMVAEVALPSPTIRTTESFHVKRSTLVEVRARTDPDLPSLVINANSIEISKILGHEVNWRRCPHGSVTASDGMTLLQPDLSREGHKRWIPVIDGDTAILICR